MLSLTRSRVVVVVLATIGLLAFATMLFISNGASGRGLVAPAGSVIAGVFVLACSASAAHASRGRQRLAWTVLSTGLLGWTAGQAVWCYVAVGGSLPVAGLSAANFGYLILPLCALAAALAIPSRDDARFGIGLLLDGILVTASLLIVLVILALGRAAHSSQTVSVPALLLATAAGVYVGLVATTFVVVRKAEAGRKLSPTLMMLGWGIIAVAGVVHVATDHADQAPNNLVVLGWAGGMYFVALSGITSQPSQEPDLGFSQPSSRASLWLPYLPVLLAIVVGTVHFWPAYRGEAFIFLVCVVLFVTTLARHILLLDRKQRLLVAVSDAALRDPLTGLANQRLFDDRLAHALRLHVQHSVPVSVLTVSVDDFKLVNDTLGYDVGDELLRAVGQRIQANTNDIHTVARMNGDEFAILVEDRPDAATQVANGLARSFEEPIDIEDHRLDVRVSIGVASANSGLAGAPTPGDLLRQADSARSVARQANSANVRTFTPEMDDQLGGAPAYDSAIARLQLLGELRRAIENGSLTLLYQPKFGLLTGSVRGVEALVRWQHPRFGVLKPAQFLPLVREHGLMHALTDLVLSRAVADAAAWHAAGAAIPVAINLAAPSLDKDALPDRIMSVLHTYAMSPGSLTIEITEDLVVADLAKARTVLNRLRENGIRVAIDDFGSGYATLTYLRELPVDEVKLGREFIAPILHDDRAAIITHSVIELASAFGIATVAEGVEDLATAQRLKDYGCDAVQGNFFCRPLPASEIPRVSGISTLAAP
ncbi:bifunctional diguanylate cyclase/phosphodiesterase [Mycobacterium sp. 852002-30065_SCH5024008]|uniref:putative bifunctional diguanylate cyclase/phosphodiesterase n=1 Tax=Mycobacterium sp. 852002-30065_SCH5024008 TaxID=1834088 RepID=UPI0018D32E22|nr:bifunctional diguanylate cyclase/phosphodiesterase [Mycobacterium sp. 852002-30065_SCH5024008]